VSQRSLDETSGPWSGFWVQENIRGTMRVQLDLRAGIIVGSGSDMSGRFEMVGSYSTNGEVTIRKTYCSTSVALGAAPCLDYRGSWTGTFVHGEWSQMPEAFNHGIFELWPDDEAEQIVSEQMIRELSIRL
jgi:hypothetical protein